MTGRPGSVAVIHLALASYGLEPFRAFARSYQAHPAGCDHRLVVGLKGFAGADEAAPFRALAQGIGAAVEMVPDGGFDLGSYRLIAERADEELICLLNTRATIAADDWLRLLAQPLIDPGIGAVGATGSLQSLATDTLRPALDGARRSWLRRRLGWLYRRTQFPPFPNPHLRTNGFLIRRLLWLELRMPRLLTKLDAMRFESGRDGMTRQLDRRGLGVRLIGADGRGRPIAASTDEGFWLGEQRGLLIEDNQTRRYNDASPRERLLMTSRAWRPLVAAPRAR